MAHCICCWLEVLFHQRPWLTRDSTGAPPETTLYLWTFAWNFACCNSYSMPRHKIRLRGRPRRGSTWRPHRTMAPPSETTHLLALVPQSHSSAWRVLHSLSMTEPPDPPPMAPPSISASQHPSTSHGLPHDNCTPADSLHSEQLKDKLSIFHGLVFDLLSYS
jgi:hypothetical protein